MPRKVFAIFVLTLLGLSGCSGGKAAYQPPESLVGKSNTKVVKMSKNELWKKMIPALAKSFYVINNIDKDSGLINISYQGDPEKYLDCGEVYYSVSNLRGKREYRFPGSRAEQSYETMQGIHLIRGHRKMDLHGRMNLIFEEMSKNRTRITANVRYILTKTIIHRYADRRIMPNTNKQTISFDSRQRKSFPGVKTTCQPTGLLEQGVLDLAGPSVK